jgi:hypothetical protein
VQKREVVEQAPSQVETATATDASPCVIYSIGGNNEWALENDLLKKTTCEIHTFDCTGPPQRFTVPENDGRLHFHHVCLGTEHEDAVEPCPERSRAGWSKCGGTWTLLEIQQRLGHDRIDLLKIDIEGWEWPLFESWPLLEDTAASSEILLPMQILVEIHSQTVFPTLWESLPEGFPRGPRRDWKFAPDIVHLEERLLQMGYVVVERDDNYHCQHCTELTLVRSRCPSTGVYAKHAAMVASSSSTGIVSL